MDETPWPSLRQNIVININLLQHFVISIFYNRAFDHIMV